MTTKQNTKLPTVRLIGLDGNSFSIMGRVQESMRKYYRLEISKKIFKEYKEEAQSGDYNKLLQTTMKYCVIV